MQLRSRILRRGCTNPNVFDALGCFSTSHLSPPQCSPTGRTCAVRGWLRACHRPTFPRDGTHATAELPRGCPPVPGGAGVKCPYHERLTYRMAARTNNTVTCEA